MSFGDLVHEMHVRLLAGFGPDAVLRAAVIAEAALKAIAQKPPETKAMLGELIGELRKQLPPELVAELNWLNQRRIASVHFTGQVRAELDDDARRATELAGRLATQAGLIDEATIADLRRRAEWTASEPASKALLRLDRAEHRKGLDDLVALPRRVLVLVVHGEYGQGHDHMGELTAWRLRAGPKGQWRELPIAWPAPASNLGVRFSMLIENLAAALAVTFEPPAVDPMTDEAAWKTAIEPILAAIDRQRQRLFLRHTLRWLGDGASSDDELVEQYVRRVWWPIADRRGERVVISLDVRRVEPAGMPLSKTWRTSRAERKVTSAIVHRLEQIELPREAMCATLPELTSVDPKDLADWLRAETGKRRDAAEAESAQLHATTRGGRFELVAERLTALNLDRREPR